ncbi:MAG: ATP-binding protein, partial [Odoribacter sp.]|nr:ATP-binding protein [Odoribacter sp.]
KDNLFEMKITDNGPGIEKCYLKKIFISYFRIPTNIKKMKTGMGIGLPLAKKIVNAHGGEIWAESEFGKGCCIVVQIPIFDYGT